MTVEQAVVEHLVAAAGVAALVGARVYQLKLPQKPTLPAVLVQLVDEPMTYHLRGDSATKRSRVQIDAYADDSYSTAVALADAVDAAMSGQRFSAGSPVEMEITGAFRQSRMPFYDAAELRQVRMIQDYFVWSKTLI